MAENSKEVDTSKTKKIKVYGDDLLIKNIWSYGVGHFMNDICASSWFFFLSYYLIKIIGLDKQYSSYVLLSGQVADAFATPLVGIFSDKTETRYGKRTPWYVGGTVLVSISFTLIFFSVIPDDSNEKNKLIYYAIFASLFNVGWASVQVSHMALLPSITLSKKKKDLMTRIRTGFTFLAQTLTLLLSFLFFWLINDKILQYKALAGSSIILGLVFSIVFLVLCREHQLSKNIPRYYESIKNVVNESCNKDKNTGNSQDNVIFNTSSNNNNDFPSKSNEESNKNINSNTQPEEINWIYWMKKPDFYYYIFVYMFVRLSINITSTVIPFFMELVLGYEKTADGGTPYEITICLLISTIGSISNSLIIQKFIEKHTKTHNKRIILIIISTIFVAAGCIPLFFLSKDLRYPIYILCFVWGIGFSQALSCVSSLINDVVGSQGNKGAFVYGAFSFADKLSCGLVLLFFLPIASENKEVLKFSVPFFPPGALIFAVIFVWLRMIMNNNQNLNAYSRFSDVSEGSNTPKENNPKEDPGKNLIDNSKITFITNHEVYLEKSFT